MKIAEADSLARQVLREIHHEGEADKMADMVVEEITSLPRSERLIHADKSLSPEQSQALQNFLQRLKEHEPIQYILGKSWFYNMELFVDSSVLIPRAETEELVQWVVDDVKAAGLKVFEREAAQADVTDKMKILDVGTGSGCIALALKKAMPRAEVWGCDVSDEALNVARRNGSALNIRVDFQGVNFLDREQQKGLPTVDIVISNPPYVPLRDKPGMDRNVVEHEPHTALFVPDNDALIFYKALADFGKHRLYPNGRMYMEIHEGLGPSVVELFQSSGYRDVALRKDMQGKDRMVRVKR